MRENRLFYVLFICIFLCSCGVTQPQEQGGKESAKPKTSVTKVTPEPTVTVEPTKSPNEKSSSKPTEDPIVWNQKENVKIAGRRYSYVDYKVELSGEVSIYSMRTKEDVLYIPNKIDGKPVRFVRGFRHEYPWQKNKKDKLKKIVIQEGVKEIAGFANVVAEEIILPKSLKKIASSAFENAKIKRVVCKSPYAQIEDVAFWGATLEKIDFPNGFQGKLGDLCFQETRLKEFFWPDYSGKVKGEMGKEVFAGCKKLEKIIFPENAKHIYIPFNTFWGCTKLKNLEFPASTKKVTYKECYYADNYKRGVSTLIFRGRDTKLAGGDVDGLDAYHESGLLKGKKFITVKRIVAPENSKAIQFAKKAVKISFLPEWVPEVHISYSEPVHVDLKKDDLIPVKYEYLP